LRAIATRALQRLLTAIVLPGALLAVGPLPMGLVRALGGLTRLLALAMAMTLVARLGTLGVLAMPVRPAMAPATVRASIRPAAIAGILALLAAMRAWPVAVRYPMTPF
jgi:hypothetical protein